MTRPIFGGAIMGAASAIDIALTQLIGIEHTEGRSSML
jgi:hypothetical protein